MIYTPPYLLKSISLKSIFFEMMEWNNNMRIMNKKLIQDTHMHEYGCWMLFASLTLINFHAKYTKYIFQNISFHISIKFSRAQISTSLNNWKQFIAIYIVIFVLFYILATIRHSLHLLIAQVEKNLI